MALAEEQWSVDDSTLSCELSMAAGSMPTMPSWLPWLDGCKYRVRNTAPCLRI